MPLFLYQTLKKGMIRKILHIILALAWLIGTAGIPADQHPCGNTPMIGGTAMDPEICYVPGVSQNGILDNQACADTTLVNHTCKNKTVDHALYSSYIPSELQISFHQDGGKSIFPKHPPLKIQTDRDIPNDYGINQRFEHSGQNHLQSLYQVFRL